MFIQKIINSFLQICLFSFIPFIWWLVTARKKESFFKWLGFKKVEKRNKKKVLISVLVTIVIFLGVSFFTLYMVKDIDTATSEFEGLGIEALLPAFVYAIFNTSLPEEIIFRGFLLKRVSNKFGFALANIVQSIVFGLLHGVMFFSSLGALKTILIILFTGAIAYIMGYINEKKANGSIFPSWIIHAIANIFSAIISMFSII